MKLLTTKRILQFLAGFLVGYLSYIGFSTLLAELKFQAAIRRVPVLGVLVSVNQETCEHCHCYHELEGECHICGKRHEAMIPDLEKKDTIQ